MRDYDVDINELLPKLFRAYRIKNGYSQEKLGELLNVSPSKISKIETGKSAIFVDFFFEFCEKLKSRELFVGVIYGKEGIDKLIENLKQEGYWKD